MSETDVIVCDACGVINPQAQEVLEELEVAKDEVIKKGTQIKRLQKERSRTLEADPSYSDAVLVLNHWREVCFPSAKEPLSKRRMEPVLDRLHGRYFVSELQRAADGYARFPFMVRGRRCAFGVELDRVVEADFIYRSPQNVDRGLALANAPNGNGEVPSAIFAKVPWEHVWRENHALIVGALKRRFGGSGLESGVGDGKTMWPCPFCQHRAPDPAGMEANTLSVENVRRVGNKIVECYICGLTDVKLLSAVTDGPNG